MNSGSRLHRILYLVLFCLIVIQPLSVPASVTLYAASLRPGAAPSARTASVSPCTAPAALAGSSLRSDRFTIALPLIVAHNSSDARRIPTTSTPTSPPTPSATPVGTAVPSVTPTPPGDVTATATLVPSITPTPSATPVRTSTPTPPSTSTTVTAPVPSAPSITATPTSSPISTPIRTPPTDVLSTTSVLARPDQPQQIRHAEARLDIPVGALDTTTQISIASLNDALPGLDTGMTNVTRGPRAGYRFLPHGSFRKQVYIRLPYDPALVPPGMTPADIYTFYFDRNTGRWQQLPRFQVDTVNHEVVSCTDHFTDMINGVVTVPDAPESSLLNPTQFKDMQAASPSTQIGLINPPQAGPMGDAGLSFPIALPQGRAGVQPQLAIGYSSAGGNSWLGQGWDLQLPAVTIETQWGVPRYDAGRETETYLLDGQQLTPLAHRDLPTPRVAERVFHTRVEGAFLKIVRHGDRPQTYWWEVTDKDGTTYAYGGDLAQGRLALDAVLTDAHGNIFQWALRTVRDTHGNTIEYRYVRVRDTGLADGSVAGTNLYPQHIHYTGFGDQPGPYRVTFLRDRDLREPRRPDVIISGRGGFKQVIADRLRQIEVRYHDDLVRRYELTYRRGAFGKTLLAAIAQYGAEGGLLATHRFDYYNDIAANGLFGPPQAWNTGSDGVSGGLFDFGKASALGADQTDSTDIHLYIGINPLFLPTKQFSIGGKVGGSWSESQGLLAQIDLNGDGLPDKVFRAGDMVFFRPNRAGPFINPTFGPPQVVGNLSAISASTSTMVSGGAEIYTGASVGFNLAKTVSESSIFFLDVNSDGLPDLVNQGRVLFNHRDAGGQISFSPNSSDTPYPIGRGAVDTTRLLADMDALRAELAAASPLLDTVRRWVAPYDGQVQIGGAVALLSPASAPRAGSLPLDGVRVAIQHNERELWATAIPAGDFAARTPTNVGAVSVRKGDQLFFRVQSVDDGRADRVRWNPAIQYLDLASARDANNQDVTSYSAADDFVLSGYPGAAATMPLTGTVQVGGTLRKLAPTSDDVTVRLLKNDQPLQQETLAWDQTGAVTLARAVTVVAGDRLAVQVGSDSPIDLTQLTWDTTDRLRLVYTAAEGVSSVVDAQGQPLIAQDLFPSYDLYPENDERRPLAAWVAPATGTYTLNSALTTAPGSSADGTLVLTVKRPGALLTKRAIPVTDGTIGNASLTFTANQGDRLFFELSTRQPDLPAAMRQTTIRVTAPGGSTASVPTALRSASAPLIIPPAYRGWAVFGYDGSSDRATSPITISPDDLNGANLRAQAAALEAKARSATRESVAGESLANLPRMRVITFYPQLATGRWQSPDQDAWVQADAMSSSRNGADTFNLPQAARFAGAGAVSRVSSSTQASLMLGAGFLSGSLGTSHSTGELDMFDTNGDMFPDIVSTTGIQYTTPLGALEGNARAGGFGALRASDDDSLNFGVGGNYPLTRQKGSGRSGPTGNQMPSLGLSGNLTHSDSETGYDYRDVNGDGLPDRVSQDGGRLMVALNIGYSFLPAEPWGDATISTGSSTGLALGASLAVGFNDGIYGFGGGLNLSRTSSNTKHQLIDLNGDGLADAFSGSAVSFNPGGSFTGGTASLPGTISGADIALGGGVYVTIGIPIGLATGAGVMIIINPGAAMTQAVNRSEAIYEDVDGDGTPDYLESDSDNRMTVRLSNVGRTNLLRQVQRPLGATFTLDYARTGNTYAQPQNRWVLSRVAVDDGHAGDGQDVQLTTYRYQDGVYDRRERAFYGFRTVVSEQRDAGNGEALYRSITQTFDNTSFYSKGLLLHEIMTDAVGNRYQETTNTYLLRNIATGQELAERGNLTATVFPELRRTDTRFYEGQPQPGKQTYVTYAYDALGNVTRYVDGADVGAWDDVSADISYFSDPARYIVGTPNRTVVTGGGQVMRRREATVQPGTGDVLQVRQYLADGQASISDLTYDRYGNILSLTGPSNARGQRYRLDFTYDPDVATYNTRVEDSFGYVSTSAYDLRYSQLARSVDINGQPITSTFDQFGRVVQVVGPYQADTRDYTIQFEYHPEADVPWALTRHIDTYRDLNDPIETVLFIDGLTRVIQTKQDATIHQGSNGSARDQMTVSGHSVFDFVGRTVAQSYPVVENLGHQGVFNPAVDPITPTLTTYDVLDRVTSVTIPDGSVTHTSYGFGPDRAGATQFLTRAVDANGIPSESYRDVRELITAIKQFNHGGAQVIWTSYAYDPLKQIVRVTDDQGNQTTAAYDLLGRRTALNSPDSGLTETTYDLASNVVRRVTANLRAEGTAISYDYDYTRLTAIRYPNFSGNNVTYTYGGPGAAFNRTGRIVLVRDESGSEERFYGPLGEVVKVIKTVASDTQGNSPNSPEVYTSEYTFDTWNRLQAMVYPDGEVLTNRYDSGGLLRQITGVKGKNDYAYLDRLEYDKFEQRVFAQYPNGTRSAYAYDPLTRRLAGLQAGKASGNGQRFQDLTYAYDKVGNILGQANHAAIRSPSQIGGATSYAYRYDDLYRLVAAEGTFDSQPDKQYRYTLAMGYDTIHNILAKDQQTTLRQPSGQLIPQQKISYDWQYAYGGPQPHAPTHIGERTFTYDANGNQTGWTSDVNGTRRSIVWDEENRIQAIADNGHTMTYKYNDAGERVIKRGPQGETVYVSQFFVIRNREVASKHVFAGTERVVTKLMQQDKPGSNPKGNQPLEKDLYFYHPDHLGSSSYVSDAKGDLYQHLEYFPFGETFVEESSNTQRTPYLFTGKELDEETQLYYYGARYYDPRTSVWQSADPILEKYLPTGDQEKDAKLPGMGGVFNTRNLGVYGYSHNNPVQFVDPDGNQVALPYPAIAYVYSAILGVYSAAKALPYVYERVSDIYDDVKSGRYLLHYTSVDSFFKIISSQKLYPSISSGGNSNDATYGSGQYFTDLCPLLLDINEQSYALFKSTAQEYKNKTMVLLVIDTQGWNIERKSGIYIKEGMDPLKKLLSEKNGIYLRPGTEPLSLEGRIKGFYPNPQILLNPYDVFDGTKN